MNVECIQLVKKGKCSHWALTEKKHNSQYEEETSEIVQIILFYILIALNQQWELMHKVIQ